MIISRTPSGSASSGGGTDLPDFCDQHGGAVLSTAIDKWITSIVAPRFEGDVRVSYSRTEIVGTPRPRARARARGDALTGVPRGVDIVTLADVPSQGTGLGSSSAVTVGLLNALYAFQGIYKPPLSWPRRRPASRSTSSASRSDGRTSTRRRWAGSNLIEFLPRGGGVRVEPVVCAARRSWRRCSDRCSCSTPGRQRSADDVLLEQRQGIATGGRSRR